jgi:hypothetical protein
MSNPKFSPRRHADEHRRHLERRKHGRRPRHRPGTCRFCGCTEDRACILGVDPVDQVAMTCSWTDKSRIVCSNPKCIAAHIREMVRAVK